MSAEINAIIAYARSTGVPHRVTSTLRPGAVTASGHPSRHATGLAVDFAGLVPSVDSPALAAIFNAFVPIESRLNELIYAGPQVTYNIKRGNRVSKYAQNIHHNHVHVAVDRGVLLAPGAGGAAAGGGGTPATLKLGVKNSDAVRDVQKMLNRVVGPAPGLTPDGDFGPKTDRAVRAFQKQARLGDDGIVGPLTREALVKAFQRAAGLKDDGIVGPRTRAALG